MRVLTGLNGRRLAVCLCCSPVERPVVLKGVGSIWVPSGDSGRRWSGVFPHTTSASYRRRGYYKRPLIQSEIRKQSRNFSRSSRQQRPQAMRIGHMGDCVSTAHMASSTPLRGGTRPISRHRPRFSRRSPARRPSSQHVRRHSRAGFDTPLSDASSP